MRSKAKSFSLFSFFVFDDVWFFFNVEGSGNKKKKTFLFLWSFFEINALTLDWHHWLIESDENLELDYLVLYDLILLLISITENEWIL